MGREITKICVVGSGTLAAALTDLAEVAGIKISDDPVEIPSDCQFVVEAVSEQFEAKADVLHSLAEAAPEDAVLVTTTSTLRVTDLALASGVPHRVVGLHLSLPGLRTSSAEVVRTALVDNAAVDEMVALAVALGLTPMVLSDRAGFVTARLLYGYLNQAAAMVEAGYATKEDVDAAMRFGCGYPVGPLAMLDAIGLDVAHDSLASLHRVTGERVHAPAPILRQLVASGRLGCKSGRGFYRYEMPGSLRITAEPTAGGPGRPDVAARPVKSVAIIGSGTMATGMVEVFAKAGYSTTLVARGDAKVARALAALVKSLDRQVAKGRLSEKDRDAALGRVVPATSVAELDEVDLVVEAVVEDLAVKRELFRALDQVCKSGAVLATTTSSLPVVEMAAVTERPRDVVGLHFFNPAPVMKLVEIVSTVDTAAEVVATAREVCAKTGRHAVECGDRAGFIVNALLFPYLNDAVRLMEADYATKEQIDAVMKSGAGFPMGPFQVLDVVGNDVSLAIQEVLLEEFCDPGFQPAKTLRDVVAAGFLGRKSGRGFYDYS